MSNPAQARTTSRGRIYQHPVSDETFWSVTTILKALPKDALVAWGMKVVAEYAVREYERLFAMVKAAGEDQDALAGVIGWLKGSPWRERDKAADIGTAVHARVEAHILGRPLPPPPLPLRAKLSGFDEFIADFAPEFPTEFEAAEMTVYNRREKYAGTLDFAAFIGGRRLVVDTKAGKGVYPEAALQLTAYTHAEFTVIDGQEIALPRPDGGAVLHLTDEPNPMTGKRYAFIPVRTDDEMWRAFRYVREVFRFSEETSKSAIGVPLLGPDGVAMTFAGAEVRGAA